MADRFRVGGDNVNTNEITHFATATPVEPSNEPTYVESLPGDPRSRPVLTATEFSNNSHKKKSTSFQITSVTVQGSRLGNDTGEDSADDLDESHTEDISSDVLDCSKTTDLDTELVSSDNSNANVEEFGLTGLVLPPTATQPSKEAQVNFTVPLTISVNPEVTIESNVVTNTGVTLVTTTTSPPGVTAQVPMVNSMPDHWQHRFKVVKIVSSEPFKRGRWLCMDFTDPPAVHNEQKNTENVENSLQQNSTEPINILSSVEPVDKNVGAVTHVYEFPNNQTLPGSIAVKLNTNQAASQPVYSILVPVSSSNTVVPASNLTSATGVQTGSSIVTPGTSVAQNVGVQTAPVVASSNQQPVTTTSSATILPNQNTSIPANTANTTNNQQQHQQHMMGSSNVVPNPNATQINQAPPVTSVPTNNSNLQQSEVNQVPQQQPTVSVSNIGVVQQTTSLPPPQSSINVDGVNMPESSQPMAVNQKNNLDVATASTVASSNNPNQSPLLEMLPDALGTKVLQDGDDPESIYNLANHLCLASGFGQLPNQESEAVSDVIVPVPTTVPANQIVQNQGVPSTWLPSGPREVKVQESSAMNSRTVMVESLTLSAPAGTSTVAIDNKIEQAMDLVKSHLMFAVREEVDVLKEKITELMDRISQLELENGILKANASQETLSQLPPTSGSNNTVVGQVTNTQNTQNNAAQTVLPNNGTQQIIRPNGNQNQTQNNQQQQQQQTTTS